MMKNASGPAWPAWRVWLLRFGAAFFLLNTLLTFENRRPGLGVAFMPRLSFELCLLVLALMAWGTRSPSPNGHVERSLKGALSQFGAARRPLSPRGASVLAGGFVLLTFVRYIDVTVPAVFGRPVNLYWDGRHAFEVLPLGLQAVPLWQVAAAVAALVLGLLALHRLARWALVTLAACLVWQKPRPALWAVGAALTLSFAAHDLVGRDTRWFFSLPISPTIARQALLLPAVLWPQHGDAVLSPSPVFNNTNVSGLHGADVLLVFAESYGVTTLDNPDQADALRPARERLLQAVQAGARGVVSARVRSPTYAGGSWLAHAALLSGVDTHNPDYHDLLLASQRSTLVAHFAQHGYRTVGWMPGLQRPWPEGAFFGFDRLAGADGIGYAGLPFGYWRIPDQAAMALLHAQELVAPAPRQPRFIVFPTLGTHAPFVPLPPYLQDWSRVTQPDAYGAEQRDAALAAPVSWREPVPSYIAALRYQFDWLTGYLQQRAPRHLVLIVVGDHQPLAAVSGPRASWDVPVHVISDNPALLQRLVERGFVSGLQPPVKTLGAMHELTRVLLAVFDGPSAPAGAGINVAVPADVVPPHRTRGHDASGTAVR